MAILPEPPPAYDDSPARSRSSSTSARFTPALGGLPDHLLLQLLSHLSLSDLHSNARTVNRRLFLCSTHLLRRWLLPGWKENVLDPTNSDPLGLSAPSAEIATSSNRPRANSSAVRNELSVFRFRTNESAVYDLFIAACAREFWNATASSLLLRPSCTPSTTHDLFSFLQPRARLTDLIIHEGVQLGLVAPIDRARGPEGGYENEATVRGEDVEIKLSPRKVELLLPKQSPNARTTRVPRTVVDVPRPPAGEESGHVLAERCARALGGAGLVRVEGEKGRGATYLTANGR